MTTWTSSDGKHRGTVELREFSGRRVDHEYDHWYRAANALDYEVFDIDGGVATNTFGLLVVCSCGWHKRWPDSPEYLNDLTQIRLTPEGDIDVEESEASGRRDWQNHVDRPEEGLVRQLRSADPLVRLIAIKSLRDLLDDRAAVAAADARLDDRSWEVIGRCLGISKQAARARYVQPKTSSAAR